MAASKKYRPVVFLDTNAVHSATIALAFAAKNTFDLFTETWSEVEKRLKAYRISERAAEDYQKGFLIARYLRHQSAAKADLYYSPITRLELICGALRARAIKKAASSRVPNRWYSRVGEKEIRDQLDLKQASPEGRF